MTNKTSSHAGGFYLKAKKSLGQNFLHDTKIIQEIVSFVDNLFKNDNKYLHEIGPGSGALTLPLLDKGIRITAIEKDRRAIEGLQTTLKQRHIDHAQWQILESDILKWDPAGNVDCNTPKPICVGNIPYYITSDIFMWFCKQKKHYCHGVFMIQNEVADRLIAKKGTKDYSRLSVKLQLHFTITKVLFVPAACFTPKPKVDSAIVLLTPTSFSFDSPSQEASFESFTTMLFSARRKMLRRVFHSFFESFDDVWKNAFWEFANTLSVFPETRPDAIGPVEILKLHGFFWEKNCDFARNQFPQPQP